MAAKSEIGYLPGLLSEPRSQRRIGPELPDRLGVPAISLKYDDTWETLDYFHNQAEDVTAWQTKAGFTPGQVPRKRKGRQENESEVEDAALREDVRTSNGASHHTSEGAANVPASEGADTDIVP